MFSLVLNRESVWIPVILLVTVVSSWVEMDLYAPSFPQMMHDLSTTAAMMQWTLSLNFLGFFFASLLCGPLADAFGRRIVVLLGTLVFVLGSVLCLVSTSIEGMLFGRLVQGIGVSAPVTVCMAIVADIYSGEKRVRLLSRMNSVITICMALAPVLGVYITEYLGWRVNFVLIFALSVLGLALMALFVPETQDQNLRAPFKPKNLVLNYVTLLKSKEFMSAALGLCLSVTPYFILIGILPLLFMEQLGMSLHSYAWYQGSIVGSYSVLSLCTPYFMRRFSKNKIIFVSTCLAASAISLAMLSSLFMPDMPWLITTLMLFYVCGIVFPPTMMFACAMDMFAPLRACASSLIQSLRMLFMASGTALAGLCYGGLFKEVALVMLGFMVLSLPMIYFVVKKNVGGILSSASTNQAMH